MNVLVVDDREENRLILEHKLRARGFSTAMANNGVAALQHLRTHAADAVITDLLMPEMDGYQLTHAIKSDEALQRIPVIVYTSSYTDPKDEALARNLGASAFILKPAEDEHFFRIVGETIAQAGRGELPARSLTHDEVSYLKHYTARLIHKLEDKVDEAAEANRKLQEMNITLEARVRAATAELREANAELEAYVYSVSHDLRSPLRTIEGMLSIVLENDPPLAPDEQRHLLTRVVRSAAHMQQLLSDLLAYSRLKTADVKLAPVSLERVVRAALDQAEREISEARARITVAPVLPDVVAFEPVLIQALTNLVGNAVKFVAPGTVPEVRVGAERRGPNVRITVTDNGIGIPAPAQAKIFHVFERSAEAVGYPGTGVGLAIVKRAADRMRGKLGLESAPGAGSTFWLELPAVEPAGTPSR